MKTFLDPHAVAGWLRERAGGGELRCDSRRLRAGDGFVAWPGAATDGRRFVAPALQAGAGAAVVELEGVEAYGFGDDERIAAVPGLKASAGAIASAFYGAPSAALEMVAITGTNGKTSTAWWTAQLLSACGRPCAVVGTLGSGRVPQAGEAASLVPTGLTTPDPVLLQAELRRFVEQGLRACAIEASSIGLADGRLNATRLKVAVFTNFTQDHLDYHGSMDAYWSAKAALFDWPGLAAAVVNLDDPRGETLAATLAGRALALWTVAIEDGSGEDRRAGTPRARLFARGLRFTDQGMALHLGERDARGEAVLAEHEIALPLVGRYNVSNLLCVLAAARALGVALPEAVAACARLTPVPGRMEQVDAAAGQPLVLVDYAHTPDALQQALRALQPLARQRGGALWVVVGCGGDRDAGKRPMMAAVAEREARHAVLTSDNPRSEDPLAILRQMAAGLSRPAAAQLEPDRTRAIDQTVRGAGAADVVLIAGKGHEDYQEVMGRRQPFSDRQHAREALRRRPAAQGAAA